MPNVEPSFVLYALLLEPGGCLRAHITLFELVEAGEKKSILSLTGVRHVRNTTLKSVYHLCLTASSAFVVPSGLFPSLLRLFPKPDEAMVFAEPLLI